MVSCAVVAGDEGLVAVFAAAATWASRSFNRDDRSTMVDEGEESSAAVEVLMVR